MSYSAFRHKDLHGHVMPRLLALLFALPVLELIVFALVASAIGLGKAILLQVAISAIGLAMLGSLFSEAKGRLSREGGFTAFALDGTKGLRGLAGLLLAMPGFVTDALGVLALVPEFRQGLRRFIRGGEPVVATRRPRPSSGRAEMLDLETGEWREVQPTGRTKV
jgi:UPF0716 protein FxsA